MTSIIPSFIPAYAEIFLLIAASAILVLDLFVSRQWRVLTYVLSIAAVVICAWLTLVSFKLTGGKAAYTFSDMFVLDRMAVVLKLVSYIAVVVCFVYSRAYLQERGLFSGDYMALVLFGLLGMMVMTSANHFVPLYLGLELLSLCQYALVGLNRDSAVSTEAAMKYFILGALASGLLLYGLSMLYGATGTLDIGKMSETLVTGGGDRIVLVFGLVFIVAGLAFKLGVVPFHMWVPDVYDGAPNAMALFIGSAPKIAVFALMIRLMVNGLLPLAEQWQQMFIILAVLSLAVGNLAAIAQTNFKRLLAYSTIAHMGFVLLGMLSGVVDGNFQSTLSAYSSAMFYMITYVLSALAAFGVILLLSRAGFEADQIADLKGLNRRHPWYAFVTLVTMFSLVGVPPTVGFYAKLTVLQALIEARYVWLAVVAVLFSLIGAFYYLRIVKLMYFDEPDDVAPIRGSTGTRLLFTVNGIAILGLGLLPQALMELCLASVKALVV